MTLAGKTVLVTGATGFLGSHLTRRLASEGVNVRALARRTDRDRFIRDLENVEIIMGDVTDGEQMREVVAGCDTVFHAAAALGGSLEYQRSVNTQGTRNVMWASTSAKVRHVVYVSTIAVYGYRYRTDITEDMLPNPGYDPYQITKSEAEAAVRGIAIQSDLTYSIIRPAMIYGPHSPMWTKRMFQLARLRPTPFIGAGKGTTYPIYVDDVVDMMMILATHPAAAGETFHCAPDPAPTWRDYLGGYSRLAGHHRWLPIPPLILKPIVFFVWLFSPTYSASKEVNGALQLVRNRITYKMDKARSLLNWEPKTSLEAGIQTCVPYLREKGLLS